MVSPSDQCGLSSGEPIRVEITNYGALPQSLFPLNYSVNGVLAGVSQPQDGFYTGIISRDSTETFEFDLNYNFAMSGEYTIQVWTEMMNDSNLANDTLTIVLTNYAPPFFEDFETGVLASYFDISFDNQIFAPNAHNNPTFVMGANLFSSFDEFRLDFPVMSGIRATDTLFFEYRYVNWSPGTVPTTLEVSDTLTVLASTDCGETYEPVYIQPGTEHEPATNFRTVAVPLAEYEGENIKLRILGIWGSGDYWLDIDNINLPRCDGLGLEAQVQNADPGQANGSILVTPASGIAPFTFVWNDGTEGAERTDLTPGNYTVIVTDRFGCSDVRTITVDVNVGVNDLPTILSSFAITPNPTHDQAMVRVQLREAADVQIDLVNMLGQRVWAGDWWRNATSVAQPVDVTGLPAGVYLVRVQAAGAVATQKLVVTE
ncbi:MAG: T9SS type A sorting domain-containing protein [Saprospiraceae bacterium]